MMGSFENSVNKALTYGEADANGGGGGGMGAYPTAVAAGGRPRRGRLGDLGQQHQQIHDQPPVSQPYGGAVSAPAGPVTSSPSTSDLTTTSTGAQPPDRATVSSRLDRLKLLRSRQNAQTSQAGSDLASSLDSGRSGVWSRGAGGTTGAPGGGGGGDAETGDLPRSWGPGENLSAGLAAARGTPGGGEGRRGGVGRRSGPDPTLDTSHHDDDDEQHHHTYHHRRQPLHENLGSPRAPGGLPGHHHPNSSLHRPSDSGVEVLRRRRGLLSGDEGDSDSTHTLPVTGYADAGLDGRRTDSRAAKLGVLASRGRARALMSQGGAGITMTTTTTASDSDLDREHRAPRETRHQSRDRGGRAEGEKASLRDRLRPGGRTGVTNPPSTAGSSPRGSSASYASTLGASAHERGHGPRELAVHELTPLRSPEADIAKAMVVLEAAKVAGRKELDWEAQFEALNNVRRAAAFHPELIMSYKRQLVVVLIPALDALRSVTAKASMMLVQVHVVVVTYP